MKKLIEWTRKLIIPAMIIVAIGIVLTCDSGRILKNDPQPQPADRSFPEGQSKEPSRENVAKDYTQQLEGLKKSVEKDPKNVSHLTMLATMLMDGHNPKEAIQYFERARTLEPKNISILLDLTVCYAQTGNMTEASRITDTVLTMDPKNTAALYNKGAIYAQQGKLKEAEQSWRKLIRIAPQSSDAQKASDALHRIGKM